MRSVVGAVLRGVGNAVASSQMVAGDPHLSAGPRGHTADQRRLLDDQRLEPVFVGRRRHRRRQRRTATPRSCHSDRQSKLSFNHSLDLVYACLLAPDPQCHSIAR